MRETELLAWFATQIAAGSPGASGAAGSSWLKLAAAATSTAGRGSAPELTGESTFELAPAHPTLGDVDSPQALADYQAAKKAHKAEWLASKSAP